MAAEAQPVGLTGGCQCGAVRYRLDRAPDWAGLCHCRMCQKAGGAPFMAFFLVREKNLIFTHGAPSKFRSSAVAERGFCSACGTPLSYRMDGRDEISITIGSLDEPARRSPQRAIGRRVDAALVLPSRRLAGDGICNLDGQIQNHGCRQPPASRSRSLIAFEETLHGRRVHLRPRPHPARTRQVRRRAAYDDDAGAGGDGAEGDQGPQPNSGRPGRRRGDGLRRSGRRSGRRHRPHGRAGGRLRRRRARRADQPLLRLRPRLGQFRLGAGDGRPARADDRRRRRIDEPGRHRRLGRRLAGRSVAGDPRLFHAAGRIGRPDRHQIRLLARRRRRLCGRVAAPRRQGMGGGAVQEARSRRCATSTACRCSNATSTCGRRPTCSRWRRSSRRSS